MFDPQSFCWGVLLGVVPCWLLITWLAAITKRNQHWVDGLIQYIERDGAKVKLHHDIAGAGFVVYPPEKKPCTCADYVHD